jgi:hypothetical protein
MRLAYVGERDLKRVRRSVSDIVNNGRHPYLLNLKGRGPSEEGPVGVNRFGLNLVQDDQRPYRV